LFYFADESTVSTTEKRLGQETEEIKSEFLFLISQLQLMWSLKYFSEKHTI